MSLWVCQNKNKEKAIENTKKVAEEAKNLKIKWMQLKDVQEVGQQVAAQEFQCTINKSFNKLKRM